MGRRGLIVEISPKIKVVEVSGRSSSMGISGGVSSFFAAFLKALSVLADAWVTHGQSARSSAGSLHFREKRVMDSEMKGGSSQGV
jgi:hypothetical protein